MTKKGGLASKHVAVINGRFQPFHLGHLDYAMEAAEQCDVLVVGLTRVPGLEVPDAGVEVAAHRLLDEHNPMSFAERALVVQATLASEPAFRSEVIISPFPIERPSLLPAFIPASWRIVTTEHEPWNHEKIRVLREAGYEVTVVCEASPKVVHGREIRRRMREGSEAWREDVAPATADALDRIDLPKRMVEGRWAS